MDDPSNVWLGAPSLPLRELYVPAVLELLRSGACDLQAGGLVNASMAEDKVSGLLNQSMRAARVSNDDSDILSWFMRAAVPEDPEDPEDPEGASDIVEPDFIFTWGPYPSREDRSLFVEAKKLRGAGPSLAGDYVDKGVMRFVEGSYGRGHDYGIMMGYVVVAPKSKAIARVSVAMSSRKDRVRQLSGFVPNDGLCASPDTHHSIHRQQVTTQPITLVHIFVDFS